MFGIFDVRSGSNSDLGAPEREVRFTPINGHICLARHVG